MTSKEILLYASQPFKKQRWIGYMSTIQLSFVLFSLILAPTKGLIEKRQAAFKAKSGEESDDAPTDTSARGDTVQGSATLLQRIIQLDYKEVFAIQNIKENFNDSPYLNLGIVGAASLVTLAFNIYARRMAHMITLLPDQRIRFESFTAFGFGRPPKIELPVRDISCVAGRSGKTNFAILKFKGYIGHHLVHKSDGIFVHPRLYDEHLGYARSWHK